MAPVDLAQCRVATNLQFVKTVFVRACKVKCNKMKYACSFYCENAVQYLISNYLQMQINSMQNLKNIYLEIKKIFVETIMYLVGKFSKLLGLGIQLNFTNLIYVQLVNI